MDDGWLKPAIAREYSMDEIHLAHEHLMKRHGHLGKLILQVSWLLLLLVNILWVVIVINLLLVLQINTIVFDFLLQWILSKQIRIPHTSDIEISFTHKNVLQKQIKLNTYYTFKEIIICLVILLLFVVFSLFKLTCVLFLFNF